MKNNKEKQGKTLKEVLRRGMRKIGMVEIFEKKSSTKRLIRDAEIINSKTKKNQLFLVGDLLKNILSAEQFRKEIKSGTFKIKKTEKRLFKESDISVLEILNTF